MASLRTLCTKMSAVASSARMAAWPSALFKFQSTERLPRFRRRCTGLMPGVLAGVPMMRVWSPSGGSTLITSAPRSARIWVQ